MQRLILQSVNISDPDGSEREAVVILRCGERQFVGHSLRSQDSDDLTIVALATLDAVRQYLPMPVQVQLKKAAKMQPDTLTNYLFVVAVELTHEAEHFSLTGTCLGGDGEAIYYTAKATLDATNRLIDYLLDRRGKSAEEPPPRGS